MKLNEYQRQLEESKEYTDAKNKLKIKFLLAKAVYAARTRKNWSQKDLAKAIGTKQANISRIESGIANPTLDFISRLSRVLDFDIDFSCEKETAFQFASEPQNESFRNVKGAFTTLPIYNSIFDLTEYSKTHEEKV